MASLPTPSCWLEEALTLLAKASSPLSQSLGMSTSLKPPSNLASLPHHLPTQGSCASPPLCGLPNGHLTRHPGSCTESLPQSFLNHSNPKTGSGMCDFFVLFAVLGTEPRVSSRRGYASTLPPSRVQVLSFSFFLSSKQGFTKLPRMALNFLSSCFSFLSSWDDGHVLPGPQA